MELSIYFEPGFAFLFDRATAADTWESVLCGSIQPQPGDRFGPHNLSLILDSQAAVIVKDTTGLKLPESQQWDMRGCRIAIVTDKADSAKGVSAPLDQTAPHPTGTSFAEWENWKWSLDLVGLHRAVGDAVSLVPSPEGALDGAIVLDRGTIRPFLGFPKVEFSSGSTPSVEQPYANTTLYTHNWKSDTVTLEVSKGGKHLGHIVIGAPGPTFLRLRIDEPGAVPPPAGSPITDLEMLYRLVSPGVAGRTAKFTKGTIRSFALRMPGRECASGAFYL